MTKLKVGDVFLLPLNGAHFGIGQIAGNWKGEFYVVVYDKLVLRDASPVELNGAGIQFAALTLDAKFHHGNWPVIGHCQDNVAEIPQPWFKVGVAGETHIESRDRSVTRRATATEEATLRHRTVVAPVRIENAFKALHGIGEWNSRYDDLRSDYAFESANLVNG
ncbi:MAG TPA: Imm26 family immunity protein [Allosphingosinicella sp.]